MLHLVLTIRNIPLMSGKDKNIHYYHFHSRRAGDPSQFKKNKERKKNILGLEQKKNSVSFVDSIIVFIKNPTETYRLILIREFSKVLNTRLVQETVTSLDTMNISLENITFKKLFNSQQPQNYKLFGNKYIKKNVQALSSKKYANF